MVQADMPARVGVPPTRWHAPRMRKARVFAFHCNARSPYRRAGGSVTLPGAAADASSAAAPMASADARTNDATGCHGLRGSGSWGFGNGQCSSLRAAEPPRVRRRGIVRLASYTHRLSSSTIDRASWTGTYRLGVPGNTVYGKWILRRLAVASSASLSSCADAVLCSDR
jgi:hypothetical protein